MDSDEPYQNLPPIHPATLEPLWHDDMTQPTSTASNLSNQYQPQQPLTQATFTSHSSDPAPEQDCLLRGDVVMADASAPNPRPPAHKPRSKYGHLDWDSYQSRIRELYIVEDKTLKETMRIMSEVHSFNASEKLYKAKIKEWEWQKNLPSEVAAFIIQKTRQRKRDENRDTVFVFGGRVWDSKRAESTVSRAKRGNMNNNNVVVAETPRGLSYKTPVAVVESPPGDSSGDEFVGREEDWEDRSESSEEGGEFHLTWKGLTATDLLNMWNEATKCGMESGFDEAEMKYRQVLCGMRHVCGPTHLDTTKVYHGLATLYANAGRTEDASKVVEKVIHDHVAHLGYQHRQTQQVVLQAIELLNAWNRHTDALVLASRASQLLDSSSSRHQTKQPRIAAPKSKKRKLLVREADENDEVNELAQSVHADAGPSQIDQGIAVARTRVSAKDGAAEKLLRGMITQCESQPKNLAKQHLAARAELLRLYQTTGTAHYNQTAFRDAIRAWHTAWDAHDWDPERFETFEFMEAALQLIANLLKGGYAEESRRMFHTASEKATSVFGYEDERSIWIRITIGIVYQTHSTWDKAQEWFEAAYASALANRDMGPKDGIVRSLQAALDRRYFSYLSDEGRPYKTVFGVSGIKIMPGRLHLE